MLLNYIKLSIRLLIRRPFFTFINISGLSVGFAVFFILWQHATYELQSDRFHKDNERIYRLYCDFFFLPKAKIGIIISIVLYLLYW